MTTRIGCSRFLIPTLAALVLCTPSRAAADPPVAASAPGLLQIQADLQPSVAELLRRSPTFRSQYQRLRATPSVIVGVRVDPGLMDRPYRAMSTIRRFDSGLMVAEVVVGPGGGQEGWLAHEFEHILEQLDGWNLRSLARRPASGVYYSSSAMLETARAVQAGRVVSAEFKGKRNKIVE